MGQEELAAHQQQIQTGQFQSFQSSSTQQEANLVTRVHQEETHSSQQASTQSGSALQQQAARMITEKVKTRQQLEKERDDMIKQTIMQYQKSSEMSERVKQEEDMRQKFIIDEQKRIEREEK